MPPKTHFTSRFLLPTVLIMAFIITKTYGQRQIFDDPEESWSIQIDRPCVSPRDTFITDFEVSGDRNARSWYWVGLYRAGDVNKNWGPRHQARLDGEPLLWVWSCGHQDCNDNPRRGRVRLGRNRPGEWEEQSWPPPPGQYRTVLVNFQEEEDEPEQYVAGAVSDVFDIAGSCDSEADSESEEEEDVEEQDEEEQEIEEEPQEPDGDEATDEDMEEQEDLDDDNDEDTEEEDNDEEDEEEEETDDDDDIDDDEEEEEVDNTPPRSGMAAVVRNARADIADLITTTGVLSALYLRMVFHDCVSGGCDGCINTLNPENGGLNSAMNSLRDLEEKYRDQGLSRADLYVLASYVGVDMTLPGGNATQNPMIPFTKYGRQNCDDSNPRRGPDPELCSPNLGTDEIVDFFREHFDFSAQETAAIMGAHTVGVLRRNILGFDGRNGWVPDNTRFDNQYYEELVGAGRGLERQIEGAPQWRQAVVNNTDLGTLPDRFQWEGFPGGEKVVMLNSDVAMVRQLDASNKHPTTGQVFCKFVRREPGDRPRCPAARSDVFDNMVTYRNNNQQFLNDFRDAMIKMTDTGYRVRACASDGMCELQRN